MQRGGCVQGSQEAGLLGAGTVWEVGKLRCGGAPPRAHWEGWMEDERVKGVKRRAERIY